MKDKNDKSRWKGLFSLTRRRLSLRNRDGGGSISGQSSALATLASATLASTTLVSTNPSRANSPAPSAIRNSSLVSFQTSMRSTTSDATPIVLSSISSRTVIESSITRAAGGDFARGREARVLPWASPGLHVIFDSNNDDRLSMAAEIDIIAVHGLNFKGRERHPQGSWMKGDKLWLKDILPERLGRPARVMLFSYNSSPAIAAAALKLDDHANSLLQSLNLKRKDDPHRPLVFVCHSLGGLVVKQALVGAKLDDSYHSLFEATRLVVFFATPHQGGNYANVGDVVAKIASVTLREPSNDLIDALKRDSIEATKRFEQARHVFERCLVISFSERRPYGNMGIIVDKKSAVLNLPGSREKQITLDADHGSICKFDADSPTCELILGTIVAEIERSLELHTPNYRTNHSPFTDEDNQCLMNLRVTDPRDDKTRIEETKGGLLRDSFKWVIDHADFQYWHNSWQGQLLWIKGDPGKGKTMMLCGIIDELDVPNTGAVLSFFFCQATDSRINNATSVLRGLMYILIKQQPTLIQHIQESYRDTGKQLFEDVNAWPALSRIFLNMLEDPRLEKCYLCVDALDECTADLGKLLELIAKKSTSSRIKWIITSRNRYDIEEAIVPAKHIITLSLDRNETSVSNAVGVFIEHKVSELARQKGYDAKVQEEVRKYLRENANDTFLWVALVCQNLGQVKSWKTFEKLREFPAGLQSFYKMMLDRMLESDDEDLIICKKILSVMMIARRPVALRELPSLVEILSNFSEHVGWLEAVIKLCSSFLTTRQGTVYFVHQSAKDYLRANASSKIFPPETDIHYDVYSQSLRSMMKHLRRDILSSSHDSQPQIGPMEEVDLGPLKGIRYSCIYWVEHLSEASRAQLQHQKDLNSGGVVQQFFEQRFLYWLEALGFARQVSDGVVAITKLETILKDFHTDSYLLSLVQDARRFILHNRLLIEDTPLQVYASALLFSPNNSLTRMSFKEEEPEWITKVPIVEDDWSASLQSLKGHRDWVRAVAVSCDNTWLASASSDRSIKIWNAATGKCEMTLKGHSNCVNSVVFSHCGKRVMSASSDTTIKSWDIVSGDCLLTLRGHSDWVRSVAISYDKDHLLSASSDRSIRVWNTASGRCIREFRGHGDWVNAVACSRNVNHRCLASASSDRTVRVWDIDTGKCLQILEGHGDWVNSVSFREDTTQLSSASSDGTVRIWNAVTGECLQILDHGGWVNSVAFSHDGKYLASASDDTSIKIWDTAGECKQILRGHTWSVTSLVFLPNGKRLLSASNDQTLRSWDTNITKDTQILDGHGDWINSVIFSDDGKQVGSFADDECVRIWNSTTGECMHTLEDHGASVNSIAFSSRGQLASASSDRTIKIWSITTGECIQTLDGHSDGVSSVVFSPNGRYLASTSGSQTIMLWRMTTPIEHMWTLNGGNEAKSVVFSPDSRYISSASCDRTVRIWDAALGKCLHEFTGHEGLVNFTTFSSDNRYIASCSADRTIRVWQIENGKCLQMLKGLAGMVQTMRFSPNGRYLASSSVDRNIKIWDVVSGTCFKTVDAGVLIKNVSFDPTSSYLITDIGHIMLDSNKGQIWHGYGFSPDLSWITCHGQGLLRLPYELRPVCSAVFGSTVVVGFDCGRMIFVWLAPGMFPTPELGDKSYIHVANGAKGQWQAPTSKNRLVSPTQPITIRITGSTAYELPPESFQGKRAHSLRSEKPATNDRTPLHLAVLHDDESTVFQLLQEGNVDEDAKDEYSRTALFYAMKKMKKDMAIALSRKWNVPDRVVIDNLENPTDDYKAKSLYGAIKRLKKDEIGFLIEIGADVEARGYGDYPGWMGTTLHEAAFLGTQEIIQLLLENGAKKDARDIGDRRPSHRPNWARTVEISNILS